MNVYDVTSIHWRLQKMLNSSDTVFHAACMEQQSSGMYIYVNIRREQHLPFKNIFKENYFPGF